MENLPTPPKEAMIYQDEHLYVCLASFPMTKGHTVIVWKDKVEDLHSLSRGDYEYLMDVVDMARNTLLKQFNVEKVYLMYMDEVKQVHWHLVPRYDEVGVNVLMHTPKEIKDFSDAPNLRIDFATRIKRPV
jgi:diadenosine tetraphosphate (Ap4A) HIT family hydrolase